MTGFSCRHALAGVPYETRTIDGKAEHYCPICEEENTEGLARALVVGMRAPSPDGRRMAETQNSGSGRKPDQQVPGSKGSPMTEHPTDAMKGPASTKIECWTRWIGNASQDELRQELTRIYSANDDDVDGDIACKIMSYDWAHGDAVALGFESIVEAMNAARTTSIDDEGLKYWERPFGDAGDAVDFACDHCGPKEALAFLEDWRSDRAGEWPGYINWLKMQQGGAKAKASLPTPVIEEGLVEKVARAIALRFSNGKSDNPNGAEITAARAAIEAIRASNVS